MSSEILEQKQIANNRQNKLLYELIQGDFGIPWNTFQKENRPRLAKMAGVTTEEYNDSVNKYNGTTDIRNYRYNSKIREKIVAAKNAKDVLPLNDLYENMNTLSEKQKEAVMKNFSANKEKVDMYIGNVSSQLMEKLKKLSPAALVAFLQGEIQGVEEKSKEIQSRIGGEVNVEQMANISWLVDMQKRLDNFVEKYKIVGLEREKNMDGTVRKFTDSEMEQNFQKFITSYDKAEYEKLEQKLGKNGAEESLRQMFILQTIEEKKKNGELSKEAEAEFVQMTVEFCEKVKQWGIDLAKTGLDMIYTAVLESYQSTDMYTQLSLKVMSDPEFNTHFDKQENKVEKLVADEKKSVDYYKNLIKLYPDIDTTNISTMFTEEYFTLVPAMQIKESAPEEVKKTWESFLIVANEKDDNLLERTNNIIQQSAIEQCLTALQKTMDIDIDEGKNILDNFIIDGGLDAIKKEEDGLMLNLKGTTNGEKGEKIDVSYNLSTGEVYYKKYMQKKAIGDKAPIMIGSSEIEDDTMVPFMKLPTLGSIIEKGKAMANDDGYLELMETSEDSNMYETNLQVLLKNEYIITENIDHELGQDMIKKNILEDSIVQKILKIGGREIPARTPITSAQYPSTHSLFNYLSKSFEYYSMKPMVQLENWNDSIDKILAIKEDNDQRTASPQELIDEEKNNKNQERFVLHSLVNQNIMDKENPEMKNQVVETNLLSFFKCFETNVGGMNIVDVEMMRDYFSATTKNTNEGELGKRKRTSNSNFNRLYDDFQGLLSVNEIEGKLMDQYDEEASQYG